MWPNPQRKLRFRCLMMMMMMNCYCGMVDRRKAFSLISSRDHCQRSSSSRISDTPRAGFEPAQNLNTPISHISFFQFKYRYYFETPLKNPAIIINLKPLKSLKVFTCTCDASFFILTSPPFFSNNVKTCSWTKGGLEAIV